MSNDPHLPRRGLMMMVVSPSGVGKTSLTRRLIADHADLHLSISATTRQPRPGEHDGRDYHFVDRLSFDDMIENDAFLEWAEVYGNRYGSPKAPIMAALERGDLAGVCAQAVNVFEVATHLEGVADIRRRMQPFSPLCSQMTGSGSCVFAVFAAEEQAQACLDALQKHYPAAFICHPCQGIIFE